MDHTVRFILRAGAEHRPQTQIKVQGAQDMKITWLGHSGFRIETGTSVVLIDPFLTGNSKFEASGKKKVDVIKGATHVILSHGHDDHVGDTVEICERTGATLIAIFEICMHLNGLGVQKFDPGNTGGTIYHKDFDLTFTPAWHSSGTTMDGKSIYLGNPCGLVLACKGDKTVYHMGDTAIFSDMGLIKELHQPHIGMVPIGDRFTMGAKSAALACKKYFSFEMVIPIHYGTFPVLDQTADKFVAEMRGENVKVPRVGEAISV